MDLQLLLDDAAKSKILTDARSDFSAFLKCQLEKEGTVKEVWPKAKQEMLKLDVQFANCMDPLAFYNKLISYIEEKNYFPLRAEDGQVARTEMTSVVSLLDAFRTVLLKITSPVECDDVSALKASYIKRFAEFVVLSVIDNGYVLYFAPTDMKRHPMGQAFASWLRISPYGKVLMLQYDVSKIGTASADRFERCLRKIFLHELGHARTHLSDYLSKNGALYFARPHHEMLAWAYAYSFTSTVSALRSRIDRVIGSADSEWRR